MPGIFPCSARVDSFRHQVLVRAVNADGVDLKNRSSFRMVSG